MSTKVNNKYSKVTINGRFLSQKLTGVQRYALEVCKAIDKYISEAAFPINIEIAVPHDYNKDYYTFKNIKVIVLGSKTGIKWEQLDLANYLKKQKSLGLHLCNSVPLLYPKGICCVHDITYKVNPQFITTKHLALAKIWHLIQYRAAIKKSIQVYSVSNYSRQQIIDTYKIKSEKIGVAYNGHQHFNSKIDGDDSLINFPQLKDKEYYFSLATMAKNKNFPWIVQAARSMPQSVFAVAGNLDIQKLGNTLGSDLPDNLIKLGYVSDNDAKILLKHCKAFLFPSFYEGFGIPPLEALAMGAPVICSNAACLPEVFKNSVHYINPYEPAPDFDILLSQQVDKASDVLSLYSWEKTAKVYTDFIKSLFN